MPASPPADSWIIPGVVASGLGKGGFFISIDWVRSRLMELMGGSPYPGTLNVRVAPQMRAALFELRTRFAPVAEPGGSSCPGYLMAILLRARGESIQDAWLILPEATLHADILEIVSQHPLRILLGLSDGDAVEVIVPAPAR